AATLMRTLGTGDGNGRKAINKVVGETTEATSEVTPTEADAPA
ncbi:MAG: hypothetical protein QOI44_846, partial [Actinomycetota bacterium]|nr:hypothetical protein [Actinomycetota bacterium]